MTSLLALITISELAVKELRSAPAVCRVIFILLSVVAIQANAQVILLAHWTFDEASGTVAHDTVGGFDGTLTGGASFASGGRSGNAISLNSLTNSLVNMGTSFPGFTTGNFSIAVWIKTTTTDIDSIFVSKHEGGTLNGYALIVNMTATYGLPNKAMFYDSISPGAEAISTTTVNDGNWHQLIAVFTAGANIQLFVDGTLEGSHASSTIVGNSAPLLVGGVNSGGVPSARFTGLVDDLQIYGSALSTSDVQFLYSNPGQTAIPEPSTLALLGLGALGLGVWGRRRN